MSNVITIKKGLDINLEGRAEKQTQEFQAASYAIKPPDFIGLFPKLLKKPGDQVKAGTPVFFDKYRDNILLCSPVSGRISEVRRGAKRAMLEVRIEADATIEYEDFGAVKPTSISAEEIKDKMLKSGVWPYIRQRPYSTIANPDDTPKAVFISAFDTSPLAPDYNYIVEGQSEAFQTGIDALKKLTGSTIHLNLPKADGNSKVFTDARDVTINYFAGPHPAGNVGVQINKIDPINKGDIVWYLRPQEVIIIGKLFLEGRYRAEKTIVLSGSEVEKPKYCKVLAGASIEPLVKNNVKGGNLRYISGNVLTGDKIDANGFVGHYHYQLTIIPEGDYFELFGWAMPRFNKFSFSKSYFSWLTPKKEYRLDTNINGGERAFVVTGQFEKVFPFDIYPIQLLKAIMIEDIDKMEQLGIYEVDEEDFALCEFIDTSKIEIQEIVRKGLDLIRKEMS
jgi:Na+-transporting NADH:ubiquinone oxidoreductase subunit A